MGGFGRMTKWCSPTGFNPHSPPKKTPGQAAMVAWQSRRSRNGSIQIADIAGRCARQGIRGGIGAAAGFLACLWLMNVRRKPGASIRTWKNRRP